MSSREISFWIDERWYDALSKRLKDETLEEHLEDVVDEMCNQLPQREYERISQEIWQEEQLRKQEQEANRRFSVFHVTECGEEKYFQVEGTLEFLQTASKLRAYIRKAPEAPPMKFTGLFSHGQQITQEQFRTFASERMENTGRVTGAFDIDLDKGLIDALNIMDGWQCFRIKDVSTAAYFASKRSDASMDERWRVFLDHLSGKQLSQADPPYLTGSRTLQAGDISFANEIVQNENRLEFYMEVSFDADKVFGTNVCTTENDDWLNIYANYDMDEQTVCDSLDVYLVLANGDEQAFKYRLSPEEQALLLPKMEEYCQQQWGQSLEQCCQQYLSEQPQVQQNRGMIFS